MPFAASLDCNYSQSPKTDQSVKNIDKTALIAVVTSSTIVISIISLYILLKYRNSFISWLRSKQSEKDLNHLQSSKILQNQTYQESRYVLHYPNTQAPEYGTSYNNFQPFLVKNQQYTLPLKSHSPQLNTEGDEKINQISRLKSEDTFQYIDPEDDGIYQSVLQNPVSQL